MFIFLLYFSSIIILWIGHFVFKRCEKEEIFKGVIFSFLFVMLVQVVTMGIFSVVHIVVSCISVGIINIIIGGIILFKSVKTKEVQKYEFVKADAFANIAVIGTVLCWGMNRFGYRLDAFRYETVDIGSHLQKAVEFMEVKRVRNQYFAQGLIGLLRQGLDVFEGVMVYRIAIIFELFILYMCGILFWYAIRKNIKDIFGKIMGIVIAILYLLGYPVCGQIFGSQYLVCAIMLITALLVMFLDWVEKKCSQKYCFCLLMLICCGIPVAYIQFCPVAFIALGIGIICVEKKWKAIVRDGFAIFTLPMFLAIILVVVDIICRTDPMAILSAEGYIYRDFYSDFLLVLPFALGGMIVSWKRRALRLEFILLICTVAYVVLFFVGVVRGELKGYYYYKNYYLLWLSCWAAACYMIFVSNDLMRCYFYSFCGVWGLMAILSFTKLDAYLVENYYNICQEAKAGTLFSIYKWNAEKEEGVVDSKDQELYEKAENLARELDSVVPIVFGSGGLVFPYYGFTEQTEFDGYVYEKYGWSRFWKELNDCQYITIQYGEDYEKCSNIIDSWERVFENESGFIAKVEPRSVDINLKGLYPPEGEAEIPARWAKKQGSVQYHNYTDDTVEVKLLFEVITYDPEEEGNVLFTIDGKNYNKKFEEGVIRCEFDIVLEPDETKAMEWNARVKPIYSENDLRELYILFRNYNAEWDKYGVSIK